MTVGEEEPEELDVTDDERVRAEEFAYQIRRRVLEQSMRANVGHIGSALSIADIVATVYSRFLAAQPPDHDDRDRFILSKGHAALAVYSALHLLGRISSDELNSYCADGSRAGVHPERQLAGIDFSTGSLGHGLSIGAGAALAGKMLGSQRRTFVLLSDAECNEGSIWEAAMFAGHHRLSGLIAIVDMNGQQALGYTRDVLHVASMADRWRTFGWATYEVNGHDTDQMAAAVREAARVTDAPSVVLANTVFGKGVSFMEARIMWHYMPMSDEEFARALAEIGAPR